MRTREEQIEEIYFMIDDASHSECRRLANVWLEAAERRAEERVRAEIGRDSERLDWIGTQDVVIGEYDGAKWKEVLLSRYQRTLPADLVDIRVTIDAAREVG